MKAIIAVALLLALKLAQAGEPPLPELTAVQAQALIPGSARAGLQAAALGGRFEQKKTLRDLPLPLVSSGEFLLARGLGVDWRVQKPFAVDYTLTPQNLIERSGGSQRRTAASAQPGLATASRLMLALFSLDLAGLQNEFKFSGRRDGARWQLRLLPRHAALAAAFGEAQLAGEAQLQSLRLTDSRGDVTEIRFSEYQSKAALSPAERARYE